MFTKSQSEFLLRRLQRNEVVLFIGAGFALDAKNKFEENMPTGKQLSSKIWEFLNMSDNYDDTPLQTMYELLINSRKKHSEIKSFLDEIFNVTTYPNILNNISLPFWYKIYTTNIDNLLDKIYLKSNQKADILKYPIDEYKDVDRSLDSVQIVFLNGKLPCEPSELIFSKKQYARSSNIHQPLYNQFVNDYSTTTTIFLGTSIDEPIFEQYIAAREIRKTNVSEYRPQSFLIDPYIPQARAILLQTVYNIEPIKASNQEFLSWLSNNKNNFLDKLETLKITFPSFLELISKVNEQTKKELGADFNEFSQGFTRVHQFGKTVSKNKNFLLGTSPTWNDIHNNLDAPRKITSKIFEEIENIFINEHDKLEVFVILGSAGCGKSTILKRLGSQLVQSGRTVFLSYSEIIPYESSIVRTIDCLKQKVILMFDNADLMLQQFPHIVAELQKCLIPPVIIISTRTNIYDRLSRKIESELEVKEFHIPDLDRDEIIDLIKILEQNNLLGHLKGLSKENRIKEFEYRAKKQILVAMREATKGENFDNIIKSEFNDIVPAEAKFLTACIALTTESGFTISRQDLVSFSEITSAETLFYLERNLKDIVIKAGPKQDRLLLRHRVIADFIINNCLDIETLKNVYLRILSSLASEINILDFKSRKLSLYREIINHYKIYKRFKNNIDKARELYESLIPYFNTDFQFWLQYGNLELEGRGGSLELANNYLSQSQSLRPNNVYVKNSIANLYFKMCIATTSIADSMSYRNEANLLCQEIMEDKDYDDAHVFHIYCRGNYNYIIHKIKDNNIIKDELFNLLQVSQKGVSNYPFNKKLIQVNETIYKAYLQTGIKDNDKFPTLIIDFE